MDVANPVILAKIRQRPRQRHARLSERAGGAHFIAAAGFAGARFHLHQEIEAAIRLAVILLTFFWAARHFSGRAQTGLAARHCRGGMFLLRLDWPAKFKLGGGDVLILGMGVFAVRFHNYFLGRSHQRRRPVRLLAGGRPNHVQNPVFGSGPGTFQRPYARIKSPNAEMARLAHNDYLEQFSDSGFVGGLAYVAWILAVASLVIGKTLAKPGSFCLRHLCRIAGWFTQGFGEFSLYVPALAWTAFTLLGSLVAQNN
jgi:hypothetical protein